MTSTDGRRDDHETWIVGNDGSDGADVAIRWTVTQATGRLTTVEVLHDIGNREVRRRFVHEHPTSALLGALTPADLLVVGHGGHSGLSAAILGSVATHELHHSPAPVAVIPPEPTAGPIPPATESTS